MKYLDERIIVTVSGFSVPADGLYQYEVQTYDADTLFYGNVYLKNGNSKTTIDITDIIRNYLSKIDLNDRETALYELEFPVGIKIGNQTYFGSSGEVLPFYRKPNASADTIEYTYDYNTVLMEDKAKTDVTGTWQTPANLLPTYPKMSTSKINIDYILGTPQSASGWTFDFGPQQDLGGLSTGKNINGVRGQLALGSQTATSLKWYDSLGWDSDYGSGDNGLVDSYWTQGKNVTYVFKMPDVPTEWEAYFPDGDYDSREIASFPFTTTINGTYEVDEEEAPYIPDLYINTQQELDVINIYPRVPNNTKSVTINSTLSITEGFEVAEKSEAEAGGITWADWTYSNGQWTTTAYNGMSAGSTAITVTFTDEEGSEALSYEDIWQGNDMPSTWEWIKNTNDELVRTATIDFDGQFTTDIPLIFVNNDAYDVGNFRDVVFTINADDNGCPIITISYGVYTVTYNISGTAEVYKQSEYKDDITLYNTSKNSYVVNKKWTPKVEILDGSAEDVTGTSSTIIQSDHSALKGLSRYCTIWCMIDGVAVVNGGASNHILCPKGTSIHNYSIICEYINDDYEYEFFEARIDADEDLYAIRTGATYNFWTGFSNFGYVQLISDAPSLGYWGNLTKDTTIKIGKLIEPCKSKYFVLWRDRLGSQQCQPFDMVDTYSEDITGNEITNYYGKRSLYEVEVQPKWKLQTGYISDGDFKCYEGLFVSPWVQVFDSESDRVYDVIIKDRNYTERTFANQSKKMFNLEVTFEAAEKQNMLF